MLTERDVSDLICAGPKALEPFAVHYPGLSGVSPDENFFFCSADMFLVAWLRKEQPRYLYWVNEDGVDKKKLTKKEAHILFGKVREAEKRKQQKIDAKKRKRQNYIDKNRERLVRDALCFLYTLSEEQMTDTRYNKDLQEYLEEWLIDLKGSKKYADICQKGQQIIQDRILEGWSLYEKGPKLAYMDHGLIQQESFFGHPKYSFAFVIEEIYHPDWGTVDYLNIEDQIKLIDR
jgi:hypothetical protein